MPGKLPTISVLGQDYTVDVQAGVVRNVQYPTEAFTFARFSEIAMAAVQQAEADGDRKRLGEARRILAEFQRIVGTGPEAAATADRNGPANVRGDAPTPARRRPRARGRDR